MFSAHRIPLCVMSGLYLRDIISVLFFFCLYTTLSINCKFEKLTNIATSNIPTPDAGEGVDEPKNFPALVST
jgi:hypothetical protein